MLRGHYAANERCVWICNRVGGLGRSGGSGGVRGASEIASSDGSIEGLLAERSPFAGTPTPRPAAPGRSRRVFLDLALILKNRTEFLNQI
jgi:hypothetical protein